MGTQTNMGIQTNTHTQQFNDIHTFRNVFREYFSSENKKQIVFTRDNKLLAFQF